MAIVSAELAQRVFPGENPIGRRINVTTGPENFREIVGVVGDVTQQGLVRGYESTRLRAIFAGAE